MIHRQPAFAPQQLRPHGSVAAQNPREIGGGHCMFFQQELERVQWRAFRPLHPHPVIGFNERTDWSALHNRIVLSDGYNRASYVVEFSAQFAKANAAGCYLFGGLKGELAQTRVWSEG